MDRTTLIQILRSELMCKENIRRLKKRLAEEQAKLRNIKKELKQL